MPNNQEKLTNSESLDPDLNSKIGAKLLTLSGFQGHFHEPVERAFQKARAKGERLIGNNAERRNQSYLNRLQNLISRHGNRLEQRLWDESVNQLIISPENITEDYWRSQEQILRDNGQGRALNDYEKQFLIEDIQKNQRESLKSWSDYLGNEDSPYPIWFKVYAWDGVSKMGVFDKNKQQFAKRDRHTVAPYPKLNPATLAKVYGVISDFYNQSDQSRYKESPERNTELEALVKSGNFNKLYSKILLSEKAILETPERTEDIRGEWIEYLPGDEEKLAEAAEGTPWCIADPGTGRNYLQTRNYTGYQEYDSESKAKFILFHLYDPETNNLASSACASIRLGQDGEVAEISGLDDGQALEDSLVPIVEAKVRTLPGGEEFLEAFADKKQLIAMDHKMQNGEDLTKEELEFLYEINRPIKSLEKYIEDPRLEELKEEYEIEYALEQGIDANSLIRHLYPGDIAFYLDTLISHGADIDKIVSGMRAYDIIKNLDTLISHGADIDMDDLVSRMYPDYIPENLDTLISHGADIDKIVSGMRAYDIIKNLDTLISHGADIDKIASRMYLYYITKNLDTLISHGADIDKIVSRMDSDYITKNLDTLISHGADIDMDDLVSRMYSEYIPENLDTLISHGADIDKIVSRMDSDYITKNLDTLISHGANIDKLVSGIDSHDIAENLDTLISRGANIDKLVSGMNPGDITYRLHTLISYGADINKMVSRLRPYDIAYYLNTLISHGANIDKLVSGMDSHDIAENLDTLVSHGAKIDMDDLVSRLHPNFITENLDTLRRHGANI